MTNLEDTAQCIYEAILSRGQILAELKFDTSDINEMSYYVFTKLFRCRLIRKLTLKNFTFGCEFLRIQNGKACINHDIKT